MPARISGVVEDSIAEELGLNPVIDAGLALGEGTGAVMMVSLLDMAMSI